MTLRFAVDTNVFLYARGSDHPYREPCRQVLAAAAGGVISLDASVEVVQEYVHVVARRGVPRAGAVDEADEVGRQCRLHPFDTQVLARSMALLRDHADLGVRDAVHAATAMEVGCELIISTDRVFDRLTELGRLDPADPEAPWRARGR